MLGFCSRHACLAHKLCYVLHATCYVCLLSVISLYRSGVRHFGKLAAEDTSRRDMSACVPVVALSCYKHRGRLVEMHHTYFAPHVLRTAGALHHTEAAVLLDSLHCTCDCQICCVQWYVISLFQISRVQARGQQHMARLGAKAWGGRPTSLGWIPMSIQTLHWLCR